MNKKISVNLALAIAIIAMTVTFSVTMILSQNLFDRTVSSVREKELMYDKLAEIDKTVRNDYYGEINQDTLFDMLSAGYMRGISDDYATYYTVRRYLDYLNLQSGRSLGIGVDFVNDTTSYPRVIRVYNGSPAAEIGLANGFTLRSIDGVDLRDATTEQITTLMNGEEGTMVNLVFADRASLEQPAVSIQRRQFEQTTIEASMPENSAIGYIKIITFNAQTASELQAALESFAASPNGLNGLIIDLRNNTGGSLTGAMSAIDVFCPTGPIAYQQDKNGAQTVLAISDNAKQVTVPVVALVNSTTAAGAELFAVSVRDFGLGQVVGVTTAGKGSIQCEPVRLSDGSAISYTIGHLLTSTEESFDKTGVVPDVESILKADEERNFYDLTVDNDTQIAKAREVVQTLLANRPLYDASTAPAASSSTTSSSSAASDAGEDTSVSVAPAEGAEPASVSEEG